MVKCSKEKELLSMEKQMTKVTVRLDAIYKVLMDNGTPGLITQWNQAKGGFSVIKFLVGGGCLVSLITLAVSIFK